MELSKLLLANSGLKVIPDMGEFMLPSCGLRQSPDLFSNQRVEVLLC
jgi:hypothetical protein